MVIDFIALRSIVTPSLILAAPATGAWPPLRMAKEVDLELFFLLSTIVLTMRETSKELAGLTMHVGVRRASWKKYESMDAVYDLS
jgi:hypothetical protein